MRVCIIVEGCYPYTVGGVSSWVHGLIRSMPEQEFVLLAIVSGRELRGRFRYPLPENVAEVREVYLNDQEWGRSRRPRMGRRAFTALQGLLCAERPDWETLFDYFQDVRPPVGRLLMGEEFMRAVEACCQGRYSGLAFSDLLWNMRSICLPLFLTMRAGLPRADLYHCLSAGYAGVLGSMAKHRYGRPLLVCEHGLYPLEREEELDRAQWVREPYKALWKRQFYQLSRLAYEQADLVTSLYEGAREKQVKLGCPPQKTQVTPNGIRVEDFQSLPGKTEEDAGFIQLGAILRVAPIKNVKLLLRAFADAKGQEPALKLWVLGPWEEESYVRECFALVEELGAADVVFTGPVDTREYLGRMDMTILTSLSEGQPLTVLESFAAHRPVIATDVGNCRGLILGEGDALGPAGIVVPAGDGRGISEAILRLARHPQERLAMGETGYQRVSSRYRADQMLKTYRQIYRRFEEQAAGRQQERGDSGGGSRH